MSLYLNNHFGARTDENSIIPSILACDFYSTSGIAVVFYVEILKTKELERHLKSVDQKLVKAKSWG